MPRVVRIEDEVRGTIFAFIDAPPPERFVEEESLRPEASEKPKDLPNNSVALTRLLQCVRERYPDVPAEQFYVYYDQRTRKLYLARVR
jgi:hypothetical protein